MKTLNHNLTATIVFVIFILSCETESGEKNPQVLSGELISHSDCKINTKSIDGFSNTSDTLSCIEYSYNETAKKLSLTHINAGFNCCPDEIHCTFTFTSDSIIISETEDSALCNCLCLFDLKMEIKNVEKGIYKLRIIELYREEQPEISFEINLVKTSSGSYCVTRKEYPWGVF